MAFFKAFSAKKSQHKQPLNAYTVDIHSHLIPGIDDGVPTMEVALEVLDNMAQSGFKKVVTTPHIMADMYPNTKAIIVKGLQEVRQQLAQYNIDIELEAAAEYYLDADFMEHLPQKQEALLIGGQYLLFETSYINEPVFLHQAVFEIIKRGYKPLLAHPERYLFLQNKKQLALDLKERGVLFQLNLLSLAGYYSKGAQKTAEWLVKNDLIDFVGSDCHNLKQWQALQKVPATAAFQKLMQKPLKNRAL